jgi:drug/metabolite transporter (DMT)-like permease
VVRSHVVNLVSSEIMSATSVRFTAGSPRKSPFASATEPQSFLVFAAACFAVLLFALVPATTRIAGAELSGLSIGLMRTVGAGFFSIPLLLILRLQTPQKAKDWCLLLLYAFGNFAGFPILFAIGVQHTSGSHAALIMAAMPLIIGLFGMLLEHRLPRWTWFAGAAIAVGGEAALIGMGGLSRSAGAGLGGDAIVAVACILSAIGIIAGARLGRRMSPLAATLWAITIASASLAPWAAVHLLATPYAFQDLSAITWAAVLQITLGAAVIANVSWLWAVARGGLVRVAPIQFAQPVCALFFASALLNEQLSPALLLVAAGIVFGTITASRSARPASPIKQRDLADLPRLLEDAPTLVPPDPVRIRALLRLVQEQAMGPASDASAELELVLS